MTVYFVALWRVGDRHEDWKCVGIFQDAREARVALARAVSEVLDDVAKAARNGDPLNEDYIQKVTELFDALKQEIHDEFVTRHAKRYARVVEVPHVGEIYIDMGVFARDFPRP